MMNGSGNMPMQGLMNAAQGQSDPGMGMEEGGGGGTEQAIQMLGMIVQKLGSEPVTPESQGALAGALEEVLTMLTGGM